jgi:hypothetical protein
MEGIAGGGNRAQQNQRQEFPASQPPPNLECWQLAAAMEGIAGGETVPSKTSAKNFPLANRHPAS